MTTTPTLWLAETISNTGSTAGAQSNPYIVGLTDDRFLTVWSDDTGGTQAGSDVLGQIFDAQGVASGAAFQLNIGYFLDGESLGSIAALPDGGFVIAYIDDEGGSDDEIRIERFNAAGGSIFVGSVTSGGNPASNPEITVALDGSYMVSFTRIISGDSDVRGVIVSPANVIGAEFDAAQNSADVDAGSDVTALSNGSFAIAYDETDAPTVGIEIQIVNASGGLVSTANVSATPGFDPRVTALTGGGLAVVWNDAASNGDIRFSIYDNAGALVANQILVVGGSNSQNEPNVVGLRDGGFFVVWDDDSLNQLIGQRYSATGAPIGSNVVIASVVSEPEIGLADDGRILITFQNSAGDISQVILDPRDNVINGDNTSETITSRIDGATVKGNSGNDVLLGQGAIDSLFGGIGVDTLKGGGGADILQGGFSTDTVNGDAGDDLIQVLDGEYGDNTDGGADTDTLDLSNLTNYSVDLDMAKGTYTIHDINLSILGDVNTLVDVENVSGTQLGDHIRASDNSANIIDGNDGADLIEGGLQGDTLKGGKGNDTIFANTQANPASSSIGDLMSGDEGSDTLTGAAGEDQLNGGLDIDMLLGGAGNDTYIVDNGGDRAFETTTMASTIDAGGVDTVESSVNYDIDFTVGLRFVENLTLTGAGNINGNGNALANLLIGNAANNKLNGGLGIDMLLGGAGNDTYVVDNGGDRAFETTTMASTVNAGGVDTVQSSVNYDINFTVGLRFVENLTLTGISNINGTGNALANLLTGNVGSNKLNGGLGVDMLLGGAGNDIYIVDNSGDRAFETTTMASSIDAGGTDTVQSSVNYNLDFTVGLRFVEKLTLIGTGNINGTGNALGNILTGNTGNNKLTGGLGIDQLYGGAGNDTFLFHAKEDSAAGANRDVIYDFEDFGNNETIDLSGFAGTLTYVGQSGFSAANQVRALQSGADVLIQINTAGTGGAESEILLKATTIGTIDAGDFIG
ncbi:MAG: Ca2+-binding protein toxin-related [Devosia sp.]|nr:Ca2+-binding protein toxin-related [Devosia sp.]